MKSRQAVGRVGGRIRSNSTIMGKSWRDQVIVEWFLVGRYPGEMTSSLRGKGSIVEPIAGKRG